MIITHKCYLKGAVEDVLVSKELVMMGDTV